MSEATLDLHSPAVIEAAQARPCPKCRVLTIRILHCGSSRCLGQGYCEACYFAHMCQAEAKERN